MYSVQMNMNKHTKKRVFIGLLAFSFLVLNMTILLAWWMVSSRELLINKLILTILTAIAITIVILLAVGIVALVWSIWRAKTLPSLQFSMTRATNILYPMALLLGKWIGFDEEKIKNSYIQVSNQLVKTRLEKNMLDRIMILAPHCLQWVHCPHKITININNCKRCGKCPISALIELSERYNVDLSVATGGTAARKILKEKRPQGVVAIACERDLTSGIQDIDILPVIGVVNERPEGPCCNTKVDLKKVEEAIKFFQTGG